MRHRGAPPATGAIQTCQLPSRGTFRSSRCVSAVSPLSAAAAQARIAGADLYPQMGAAADVFHRPRLMAAAIALWSGLTAASGAARGFVSLAIPRAFIGIGENGHLAFNDPPADIHTETPYLVVDLDEACRRPHLGLGQRREAKETMKPSDKQITKDVLPALRDAIEGTDQNDIVGLPAMLELAERFPTTPTGCQARQEARELRLRLSAQAASAQARNVGMQIRLRLSDVQLIE